jgi:hypothetical protein
MDNLSKISTDFKIQMLNRRFSVDVKCVFDGCLKDKTDELNVPPSNEYYVGSTDGYSGNVRRNDYRNKWYGHGVENQDAHLYSNIDSPPQSLLDKWQDPLRATGTYNDYIRNIFGSVSDEQNLIASLVAGKSVSVTPPSPTSSIISDFNINNSLAGKITNTVSGKETELGKFSLKAAAYSLLNRSLADAQRNIFNRGLDWVKGKITFWDKADDKPFDISDHSITVKPSSAVGDILRATGADKTLGLLTNDVTSIFGPDAGEVLFEKMNGQLPPYFEMDRIAEDGAGTTFKPDFNEFLGEYTDFHAYDAYRYTEQLRSYTGKQTLQSLDRNLGMNEYTHESPYIENENPYSTGNSDDGSVWIAGGNSRQHATFVWENKGDSGHEYASGNYTGISAKNAEGAGIAGKSLLGKTQSLFSNGRIKTVISAFGNPSDTGSSTHSAADPVYGTSRGRALLKKTPEPSDPWCRSWTFHRQYRKLENMMRPFGGSYGMLKDMYDLHKDMEEIRPNLAAFASGTVLEKNGFVRIAPYSSENSNTYENIHRYMFSIENLAWKGYLNLADMSKYSPWVQKGPNGGRIMWFAPYNLTFTETSTVKKEETDFIGRGEPVFSYINTVRTGTLNFILYIDHSSFTDFMSRQGASERDFLLWNAGCSDFKFKKLEPVAAEAEDAVEEAERYEEIQREYSTTLVRIYFPNDFSGFEYGGVNAMRYLRFGKGNDLYGTSGPGYEIDRTATASMSGCNPKTLVMTSQSGETVTNITCSANKNRVTQKNGNRYFIDGKDFTGNTTVCDEVLKSNSYVNPYSRWDITSFGLNVDAATEDGWSFLQFYDQCVAPTPPQDVVNRFTEAVRVHIRGYHSPEGSSTRNRELAKNRAQAVFDFIKQTLGGKTGSDSTTTLNDFENTEKWIVEGIGGSGRGSSCVSTIESKMGRYVEVEVVTRAFELVPVEDADMKNGINRTETPKNEKKETEKAETEAVYPSGKNHEGEFYSGMGNDASTDLILETQEQKMKHFVAGFHSTTPEGFNARLGFLQQCTRQGPTVSASDANGGVNASNLSFGRPPISVLRIGDFFHTRIFIDSMTVSYSENGTQWDQNPEGIGMQPRMASVSINFTFLGSQDLASAISTLPNALSFNFYANQGVYDMASQHGEQEKVREQKMPEGTERMDSSISVKKPELPSGIA